MKYVKRILSFIGILFSVHLVFYCVGVYISKGQFDPFEWDTAARAFHGVFGTLIGIFLGGIISSEIE